MFEFQLSEQYSASNVHNLIMKEESQSFKTVLVNGWINMDLWKGEGGVGIEPTLRLKMHPG